MFSENDSSLPYGRSDYECGSVSYMFLNKPKEYPRYNHLYDTEHRVKRAYNDLIVNWWWEDPFYYPNFE